MAAVEDGSAGDTIRVGAMRVCQIKKAALDKMRGMMAS
jgi:DNA-directed RNA polymerase specialized sigma subunit